jgi:glycosyltransferase involved in cell wall biosynthesis
MHTLGYLDHRDLPAVTAGATALVLPSVDEGFGMPAIEALAAGSPVIVSDIPVLREVTGGLAAGFPVGDSAALAAAMLRSWRKQVPSVSERQAQARRYSWKECADNTATAYHRAAELRQKRLRQNR